jgi:hypothetical protein
MKKQKSPQLFRAIGLFSLAGLLIFQFVSVFLTKPAYAAPIAPRNLELMAGATDGGSKPGGVVNHKFTFTLPSGGSVGSIKFEYCTTAADSIVVPACVAPTGMNAGSVTLGAESGVTGMTMHAATGPNFNSYYLSRTSAYSLASSTAVTYTINGITNPDFGTIPDSNKTFFVRITAYASLDTTGAINHKGTVAASVNEQIILEGTMPESLVFCTGATVLTTSGVPDCATATSGSISFNLLFSPTATASSTSQMAASTNAGSGYSISVNGTTLTSGSNTVTAMTGGTSTHGISQFGMNLRANTIDTIPVGGEVTPAPNASNYRGIARTTSGYEVADSYKFASGDIIAESSDGGYGGTDAQIYTVTYIANVPGSLPAGDYATTLTYICTPKF